MNEQNKFYRSELLERVNFTPELAAFRFRPPEPFRFKAGQYATLAFEEEGELIQRAYSIVSSPYEPFLDFFIELVSDGYLTPKLWKLQPNDEVLIRKRIVGDFVLDEKSGRTRHLMLATVTGIAPFLSIIRTQKIERRMGKKSPHRFLIIHGASHSSEFGSYRHELEEVSREGWVRYVPTISRPWGDEVWKGEVGRVEDVLRKYADRFGYDHKRATAYAVGHPSMIENVKGMLTRALFTEEQFKEEKYFTAGG
ncbi:MAG TPA: FAD-binding oxidoreductase [Pyrinomonadaceae bacterium]|nr:FAD-binding oxidoreductase [Pyrinomonadaceae bacterium]